LINVTPTNPKKEENSRVKPKMKSHNIKLRESFENTLSESISFEFEGAIEELFNDLKEEEKMFIENQTSFHLKRYKTIVEKILKKILNEGYETAKLKRLRKDKAEFVIVNKINSKLFEIMKEITGKNNKAFNLLKTIEEIRGLIFDLVY